MNTLIIVGIGIVVVCLVLFIVIVLKGTNQKGLEKTFTKYGTAAAKAQNNIVKNNEEILRETANITADIHKDAVKTIAHSVKEGLSDDD